jgi:hypothetical protein
MRVSLEALVEEDESGWTPEISEFHDSFFKNPLQKQKECLWDGNNFRFWIIDKKVADPALRHLTVKDLYSLVHFFRSQEEYEIDAEEAEWHTSQERRNGRSTKLISEPARAFRSMTLDSSIDPFSLEPPYIHIIRVSECRLFAW